MRKQLALLMAFLMIFTNLFGFAEGSLQSTQDTQASVNDITFVLGDLDAEVSLIQIVTLDGVTTEVPVVQSPTIEGGNVKFSDMPQGEYGYTLKVTLAPLEAVFPEAFDSGLVYEFKNIDTQGATDDVMVYPVHVLNITGNPEDLDDHDPSTVDYEATLTHLGGTETFDLVQKNYLLNDVFYKETEQVLSTYHYSITQLFTEKVNKILTTFRGNSLEGDLDCNDASSLTIGIDIYKLTIPWLEGDNNRNFALYKGDVTDFVDRIKANPDSFKKDKNFQLAAEGFLKLLKTNPSEMNNVKYDKNEIEFKLLKGSYSVIFAALNQNEINDYGVNLLADTELKSRVNINTRGMNGAVISATAAYGLLPESSSSDVFPYAIELPHSKYDFEMSKGGIKRGIQGRIIGGQDELISFEPEIAEITFDFDFNKAFTDGRNLPLIQGASLLVEVLKTPAEGSTPAVYEEFDTIPLSKYMAYDLPVFTGETYRYTLRWNDEKRVSEDFSVYEDQIEDLTPYLCHVVYDFTGIKKAKFDLEMMSAIKVFDQSNFDDLIEAVVLNQHTYEPTVTVGGMVFKYRDTVLTNEIEYRLPATVTLVTLEYPGIDDVDVLVQSSTNAMNYFYNIKGQAGVYQASFNLLPVKPNASGENEWEYQVTLNKNGAKYTFAIEPSGVSKTWNNLTREVDVAFDEFKGKDVNSKITFSDGNSNGDVVFAESSSASTDGTAKFVVFRTLSYFISLTSGEMHKDTDVEKIPQEVVPDVDEVEPYHFGDYSGLIKLYHQGATFDEINVLDSADNILLNLENQKDFTEIPVFKDQILKIEMKKGTESKTFDLISTDGILEFYIGYGELFHGTEGMTGAEFKYKLNGVWDNRTQQTKNGYVFYAIQKLMMPDAPSGGVDTSVIFSYNLNGTVVEKAYTLSDSAVISEPVFKLSSGLYQGLNKVSDELAIIRYTSNRQADWSREGNLREGNFDLFVLKGTYSAEIAYRDGKNTLEGAMDEDAYFKFNLYEATVRVNGANGFDSIKAYKNSNSSDYILIGNDQDAESRYWLLSDTYDFKVNYATSLFKKLAFEIKGDQDNTIAFNVKDVSVTFKDSKGNPMTEGTVYVEDFLDESDKIVFGKFTSEKNGIITKSLEYGKIYRFSLNYQGQEIYMDKLLVDEVPDGSASVAIQQTSTVPTVDFTTVDYSVQFVDSTLLKAYVGETITINLAKEPEPFKNARNQGSQEANVFPQSKVTDSEGYVHFELLNGDFEITATYKGGKETKGVTLNRNEDSQVQRRLAPAFVVSPKADLCFNTEVATVEFLTSEGKPLQGKSVYQLLSEDEASSFDSIDLSNNPFEKYYALIDAFKEKGLILEVGVTGPEGTVQCERLEDSYVMLVKHMDHLSFPQQLRVLHFDSLMMKKMKEIALKMGDDSILKTINQVTFETIKGTIEVYGSALSDHKGIEKAEVQLDSLFEGTIGIQEDGKPLIGDVTTLPTLASYTAEPTDQEGKSYVEVLPGVYGVTVKVNNTIDRGLLYIMTKQKKIYKDIDAKKAVEAVLFQPEGKLPISLNGKQAVEPMPLPVNGDVSSFPLPPTYSPKITFTTTGIKVITKYTNNVAISSVDILVGTPAVKVGATQNGILILEVFRPMDINRLNRMPIMQPTVDITANHRGRIQTIAYDFPEVQEAVFLFDLLPNANQGGGTEIVTIIPDTAPLAPIQFIDVPGHWAEDEINALAQLGYVKGKTTDRFYPESPITRAEFGTILARMLQLTGTKQTHFTDVPGNSWFFDSIASAYEKGVVKGISATQFGPYHYISRQDISLMVVRAYAYKTGKDLEASINELFKDDPIIGKYAREAVYQAKFIEIVGGYPDGTFKPLGNATRAEAAKMLKLLYDAISE